jgi:N-acetylmuramoyl-L-alanine amidase
MLDPWYGGEEKGPLIAQKYGKDITLEIAQRLQGQLEASGFKVYLTRNGDRSVPLEDRSFQGKSKGADVHLAIRVSKTKTDCVRIFVASPPLKKPPQQQSQTYKRDELNEELDEILKGLQADSIREESLLLGGVIRDKLKIGSAFSCIELWKGKDYILKNAHLPTVIVDFRISSTTKQMPTIDAAALDKIAALLADSIKAYSAQRQQKKT